LIPPAERKDEVERVRTRAGREGGRGVEGGWEGKLYGRGSVGKGYT